MQFSGWGNPAVPMQSGRSSGCSPTGTMTSVQKLRQHSGSWTTTRAVPALIEALTDSESGCAGRGSLFSRAAERPAGDPPLARCLEDTDDRIRAGAAEVLGKLGDPRAAGPLERVARNDPFSDVRDAAERALVTDPKKEPEPGLLI